MLGALKAYFQKTDPLWQRFQQEASRKAMFTPDIEDIQSRYAINVFVYNECQKNGNKSDVLGKQAAYQGLAYTESSDFVLYKKLLGIETYPIALPITEDQKHGWSSLIGDPGQIMGEIYSIRPYDLIQLDNYMLNTVQFQRKRVKVVVPYHANETSPLDTHVVEVFMYVGDYDFWRDQLFDAEAKKAFAKSSRLFCSKEENNKETLGAYYTFDCILEAPAF